MTVIWDKNNVGQNANILDDLNVEMKCTSDNIVKTTNFKSKGKYYSEFKYDGSSALMIGIITDKVDKSSGYGYDGTYLLYCSSGNIYTNTGNTECIKNGVSKNDILGILLDCDNHILQFSKNNEVSTKTIKISDEPVSIGLSFGASDGKCIVHANFGSKKFKYNIPKNYVPYDSSCGYLIFSNDIFYINDDSKNQLIPIGKTISNLSLIYNINNDILCNKINELFNNYNIIKIKEGVLNNEK